MKNGFAKLILGAAAALCVAAPGYSSAILTFSGAPNNLGSVSADPATEKITSLSSVPYTELDYLGTAYALDMTTLALSGNILTLSGEVFNASNTTSLPGLGTLQTLLTINLVSGLTNLGNSTQLNIASSPAVSSVTVNTTLLTDLAIPTSDTATLLGVGVIGTGVNYSYTVDSDTLTAQLNAPGVPEPESFAICGSGLAALLLLGAGRRRKRPVRSI